MGPNSPAETLPRLGNLSKIRPRRVSRLIQLIWPDIQAALEFGHTLKVVHERLVESGVSISYNQLTVYVSRLRRQATTKTPEQIPDPGQPREEIRESKAEGQPPTGPADPLENYRDRCIHNPPRFRVEGGVPDKSKLI